MTAMKTAAQYCFSCNLETSDQERHPIFYTFLDDTGDRLADVLERCLLLPEIEALPAPNPVLCGKCCSLFRELANCEKKVSELRRELWGLYKAAVIDRNDDVTCFIRGVGVQTDSLSEFANIEAFDEEPSDGEINDAQDFPVVCKLESDRESEDEGKSCTEGEEKLSESIQADSSVDEAGKWWKRRGASCSICGKWFKMKADLTKHCLTHQSTPKIESQENYEGKSDEQLLERSNLCPAVFETGSECRTKTHQDKTSKPQTVYKCRLCDKTLKSKPGALYHARSHNFQSDNKFNLKEVYRVFHGGKEEVTEVVPSTVIIVEQPEASSSDDELPLAKRRTEFIVEKIKESVTKRKRDKNDKIVALQTLKNCPGVQVAKVKSAIVTVKAKKSHRFLQVPDNMTSEVIQGPLSPLVDPQEVFNTPFEDNSLEELDGEDESQTPEELAASMIAPRARGRPRVREISLRTLIKMKNRKNEAFPPIKEPRFKCDVCGKMWKTRGELNAHRSTHSDARPYICEICGQAYKHKGALDVHVGMHRGIYQHQCPYCKKAFTQKGALQRHMPIHTGDLPYQCELCGKRFVHRTSFSIHTMAHTGVRNIKCEVCNMGVLSKSHLRRHMRIHSGEKPYECQTCGKAFAERYNLVAHQRIHDPNQTGPTRTQKRKPISCRLCNAIFDRRHKLEDHMVLAHNKVGDGQQQQQPQERTSAFEGSEVYITHRYALPDMPVLKTEEEVHSTDSSPKKVEPPSVDLSMRHVRNVDVLRTGVETQRGLDLLRLANGMVEGTHSWTYANTSS